MMVPSSLSTATKSQMNSISWIIALLSTLGHKKCGGE
jgi:hypothetical protein